MKTIIYKTLFVFSFTLLIGCNINDDSLQEPDSIVGSWKLTEQVITHVHMYDPITGGFVMDSLYEFDDIHTFTFDSDGNVIRSVQTATNTIIDTGEVVFLDDGYMVDFYELDLQYTFDLIDETTFHAYSSIVFPVCGGINYKDTYVKIGN